MTRLFVYGTLKRRGSNHAHLDGQRFIGEARTGPGFTLVALGEYPGMVPSAAGVVDGELWEVDGPSLERLDRFEGIEIGLFERVRIALAPPHHGETVHAYLYLGNIEGREPLGAVWPV